jgi:membrane protease YdiL (CAAX protease family)
VLEQLTSGKRPQRTPAAVFISAAVSYAAILTAFWFAAQHFSMAVRIGGHMPSAFASFALLLVPFWAFGFGAAEVLRNTIRSRVVRIVFPACLVVPYLVFTLPRSEVRVSMVLAVVAIPVGIAALLEVVPPGGQRGAHVGFSWQDFVVLLAVGLPVEFGLLSDAWPHPGLSAMPKLLLVDATLYAFLVVRELDGVGYDFRPYARDALVGLREWAFFAPIGIGIGLALHFIGFQPFLPKAGAVAAGWLITFFFVAIPEELIFRGLLMNLLERRIGHRAALAVSSVVFGLSHFNKPLPFNWRYVLLATIAGVFYARAWSDRRRLLSSGITHATVDLVWGVWFK